MPKVRKQVTQLYNGAKTKNKRITLRVIGPKRLNDKG